MFCGNHSIELARCVPSISSLILLNVLFLLPATPLLQLKVPRVRRRPRPFALQDYKHHRPNHRYKVQRQVHKVPNQRIRRKLGKRLLEQLSKLGHWISARFDLTPLRDKVRSILRDQNAIEGIGKSIFNEEGLAKDCEDCRGFAKDEEGGADGGKGPRGERHDGHLW